MKDLLIEGLKKLKYAVLMSFLLVGFAAFSQRIVDIQTSACERDSYPNFIHRNRLILKELKNDTLILRVGIVRNCSFSPNITLGSKEDTLILDIDNESYDRASCDCCYEINLQITGMVDTNFFLAQKFILGDLIGDESKESVHFEEFKYYQNKFIFPTLEEVDNITEYNQLIADSLKIGWWRIASPLNSGNYRKAFYYIDESGKSRAKWHIDYNENDEITLVSALSGIDSDGISNMQVIEGDFYLNLMSSK